jgi:glycosyltransferase involved in cell wall biosynthesis
VHPDAERAPVSVICFTDSRLFGGAEQAILTLLAGLDRRRWAPLLAHHEDERLNPMTDAADALGVPRWVVPPMPEGLGGARRAIGFATALRARRPGVFHAHLSWPVACKWGLAAAVAARVPAVLATVQLYVDVPVGISRKLQMGALGRLVGRYIAVSDDTRRRLLSTFGWPERKVVVVHNAIPLERFSVGRDPAVRAALGAAGNETPLALVPARLDEQKGHDVLIRAAAELPGVRFACVGDGPLRAQLLAQARELGVADRMEFLGYRDDIPSLLAACDLAVLPSRYEGLPISLIEAMAAGRPVVATNIGGTRELVRDGETGVLVPPDDPAALAAAIRALVSRPGELRRLGNAGRARAHRHFGSAAMVAGVTDEYERLLGATTGAPLSG